MKASGLVIAFVVALLSAVPASAAQKAARPQGTTTVPTAQDPNAASLLDFFKNEAVAAPKSLDFRIEGGYADIRAEAAESSGRYFLAGQSIAAVAPDIYRLDLTFKKKYQRDVIDLASEYYFTQQRTYYFWYDGGNRMVFKVGGGKKEVKIPKKELSEIKVRSLETYTIEKTKLGMNLSLTDGGTKIFLELKFI